MTEKDIINLIEKDEWMMKIIQKASILNLPDWIIGAGFVRNKVWDYLAGNKKLVVDTADIDLVYFAPNGNDEKADEELSEKLRQETGVNWEVVNEFYAHKWNNLKPYTSTVDAISKWPETVTAIGVTFDRNNKLKLIAPYGIEDLINFVVRPTPEFKNNVQKVKDRMANKKWKEKWPKITLSI
jgi:hypothetical protein